MMASSEGPLFSLASPPLGHLTLNLPLTKVLTDRKEIGICNKISNTNSCNLGMYTNYFI